ncbi:uncharacterized protein LOC142520271 [Primulina tabacum]|uniref:uncharacterized protein LOC142520271 n=1 Tax=Primulina tabacum TaxID=48773 RepID=UPI003F59AAB5
MSHYSSSSSSSSSPTSEDEVQVEVNDEIYDPGEEMMLCMLELNRKIHEASESNNEMRRRRFIQRNREASHLQLVNDYFSASPVYQDHIFQRTFQMQRELFLHIVNALEANSMYFQMRNDAARRKGLSPLQKCTAAIRQLAYGVLADHVDEYLHMDGIYPEWDTFVKDFPFLKGPKRRLFKERQESARKDVERAFGVLQSRWAIVRGPARY